MTSFSAFIISPFLTNDGVCLLFVEPILNSFAELPEQSDASITAQIEELRNEKRPISLEEDHSSTSITDKETSSKPMMRLERFDTCRRNDLLVGLSKSS